MMVMMMRRRIGQIVEGRLNRTGRADERTTGRCASCRSKKARRSQDSKTPSLSFSLSLSPPRGGCLSLIQACLQKDCKGQLFERLQIKTHNLQRGGQYNVHN